MPAIALLFAAAASGSGVVGAGFEDGGWVEALPPGAEAVVPPGRYRGPWRLRGGVTLHAQGATLEGGRDGGAVLTLEGNARVEGLQVFSADGGMGIRIQPGAQADLRSVRLSGPGEAQLYVARAALSLSEAVVEGGQYGVLAERPTALSVRACRFSGQSRDGVAAVRGSATVEGSQFRGPFGEAAVALIAVDGGVVRTNQIDSAGAVGLKLIGSRVALAQNRIAGGRTDPRGLEGYDIYADQSQLTLEQDALSDSAGPALALVHSRAEAHGLSIDHAWEVAISLQDGSSLGGSGIVIRHAPSGIVMDADTTPPDGGVRFEGVATPQVRLPP